jgi:sn-glycerol 3-phosphate transport system ATP-binding protein
VQLEAGPLILLDGRRSGDAVTLGIRPEHLTLGGGELTLAVDLVEPLGSETLVHGRVVGRDDEAITVKVPGAVMPSERVTVGVQAGQAHVFDAGTGKRIDPGE